MYIEWLILWQVGISPAYVGLLLFQLNPVDHYVLSILFLTSLVVHGSIDIVRAGHIRLPGKRSYEISVRTRFTYIFRFLTYDFISF